MSTAVSAIHDAADTPGAAGGAAGEFESFEPTSRKGLLFVDDSHIFVALGELDRQKGLPTGQPGYHSVAEVLRALGELGFQIGRSSLSYRLKRMMEAGKLRGRSRAASDRKPAKGFKAPPPGTITIEYSLLPIASGEEYDAERIRAEHEQSMRAAKRAAERQAQAVLARREQWQLPDHLRRIHADVDTLKWARLMRHAQERGLRQNEILGELIDRYLSDEDAPDSDVIGALPPLP